MAGVVSDFVLPEATLQCGRPVGSLRIRYCDHGVPAQGEGGTILFPTWFAATHTANEWIVGPGRALDTNRYRVIVVNALGNGQSSSPSNHPELLDEGRPVPISLLDNVLAQRALLSSLGLSHLHAVVGRSMGAQVALQWGCLFPQAMDMLIAFCGTAVTTPHNRVLLDAMTAAIEQAPDGEGLEVAAKIYASAVLSPDFYNNALWRTAGSSTLEAWIASQVVSGFLRMHAVDVLSLLHTWRTADISDNVHFGHDLPTALRSIQASTLLIPIDRDGIFRCEDIAPMAAVIPNAQVWTLRSAWGHRAAAPLGDPEDIRQLQSVIAQFLNRPVSGAAIGPLWPF
jgi:homoserine O-acetyltransferase